MKMVKTMKPAMVIVIVMAGMAFAQGGPPEEHRPPMGGMRELDGQGPGPGRGPLTVEQQEQVLAVLREVNPQFAQRLEGAMKDQPEETERVIRRLGPRVMNLVELKQRDPELYGLRVADQRQIFSTMKLSRELRQAKDAGDEEGVQRLKDEIRKGLVEHFRIRHQLREHELVQLEERIAQLRVELAESQQVKEEVIEKQMQRIMEGKGPEGDKPPRPEGEMPPPEPEAPGE